MDRKEKDIYKLPGIDDETPIEKLKPSPHINNITYPTVCRCDMNRNDEIEKEDEKCCCNCLHCARWSTSKGIKCHCDLTDRYLSYLVVMDTDNVCPRWEKETKWDLEREHDEKIRADAINEFADGLCEDWRLDLILNKNDKHNLKEFIKLYASQLKESKIE